MKKGLILLLATALSALAAGPALKISVLDNDVLCVRPGGGPEDLATQLRGLRTTNQVSGTVLDLRFADGGSNSLAAVETYFSGRNTPLMILVNAQTRGPAATLTAQLRSRGAAMVIGPTNAAPAILPDITVAVVAEDEKRFQENPYYTPDSPAQTAGATNSLLPFVDHMSEAELVRKKVKDGGDDGNAVSMPRPVPGRPILRDPALARAVDLLRALAVLHPAHG